LDGKIVLWNFSTRKHHKLPVAPIIEFLRGLGIWSFIGYGFGYDSIRDDYKLVRIVQYYGEKDDSLYFEVMVYSLKSNSWQRIQDFPYYLPYNPGLLQNAVFVRGALHWIVCREPRSVEANLIAAFDLGVEEYRLVPQPDYLDKNIGMSLGSLGDCLCINCNYARRDRVDIWVMEEYGVKESWTKLFSVKQFGDVRPLAYSRTGEEVLLYQGHAKLLWFDLKRKTLKNVRIPGWPTFYEDPICVGSLVPLPVDEMEKAARMREADSKKNRKERSFFYGVWKKIVYSNTT
ncbi:F-box protein CPR1-like, partial [Cornus florida]|uniref:F-box protein CPR1-like n=1 Tax=Cornus florida TaxID=4283 RepID=UPI0028A0C26C